MTLDVCERVCGCDYGGIIVVRVDAGVTVRGVDGGGMIMGWVEREATVEG